MPDGLFVVAWSHGANDTEVRVYIPNGTPATDVFVIPASADYGEVDNIAALSNTSFAVEWQAVANNARGQVVSVTPPLGLTDDFSASGRPALISAYNTRFGSDPANAKNLQAAISRVGADQGAAGRRPGAPAGRARGAVATTEQLEAPCLPSKGRASRHDTAAAPPQASALDGGLIATAPSRRDQVWLGWVFEGSEDLPDD